MRTQRENSREWKKEGKLGLWPEVGGGVGVGNLVHKKEQNSSFVTFFSIGSLEITKRAM